MVRRRLAARRDSGLPGPAQRLDRLGRREVEHMDAAALVAGESEVALDGDGFGDRRVAREAELGRDASLVDVAAMRERRLLAVERERPIGDRRVLHSPPHQPRGGDRHAVVGEGDRSRLGELAHLGQLLPALAARDRGEKADRHLGLGARRLDQGAEGGRGVDHRVGVRHRENRAVAPGRCGRGAARDRLLVLAARRAQVDVGVDEGRREDEAVRLDDAMLVRVDRLCDLGDRPAVDPHLEPSVDSLHRVEHTRAPDDEVRAG